ncbi:MAG TPA: ATP-binding protein [Acidimicrobiales bacterium]|nr:ATP-binding protein [Acidimicrobiales bacterium]
MVAEAVFRPDIRCVRAARDHVRRALDEHGVFSELAVLLASELATNAVLHARTDFTVRLLVDDETVRVEVEDANARPPVIGYTPTEATSGRGLHLVQDLARAWGVVSRPDGKVVWFELPVHAAVRADATAGV